MRKAFQRVSMPVRVVDDDAGNAMPIGEKAGMEPGRNHQIATPVNVVQIPIE